MEKEPAAFGRGTKTLILNLDTKFKLPVRPLKISVLGSVTVI